MDTWTKKEHNTIKKEGKIGTKMDYSLISSGKKRNGELLVMWLELLVYKVSSVKDNPFRH